MKRMDKNNCYDDLCHVLTDWENGEACEEDLYHTLVNIQNNWEELTGDDDD